jgi:hypothetical protein
MPHGHVIYQTAVSESVMMYMCMKNAAFDSDLTLISTYLPTLDDFKMLMRTQVRKIYYMGEIEDATTVMMLNEHTKQDRKSVV